MTDLTPGIFVRHPQEPDWGIGQVQSAIGHRVTVNFENRGKLTIDIRHVALVIVDPEEAAGNRHSSPGCR